jgi:hypothetical protein
LQPLELAQRHHDGDRVPSACQLDVGAGLGLVDDGGEAGSGFGDGVPSGHSQMYINMYISSSLPSAHRQADLGNDLFRALRYA